MDHLDKMLACKEVVSVGGIEITVWEVSPMQILDVLNTRGRDEKRTLGELLPLCITPSEIIPKLRPSNWLILWEAFTRVNAPFWQAAEMLGIRKKIADMLTLTLTVFQKQCSDQFAASLNEVISVVLNMVGEHSKSHPPQQKKAANQEQPK